MKSRIFTAFFTLILTVGTVTAAETKKRSDPSRAPEVQDVVFYGSSRPVLMRLHIYVDGKPFAERWKSFVSKVFKYADRDKSGALDEKEITIVPTTQQLAQATTNGYFSIYTRTPSTIASMDSNEDEKVTLEELVAFYEKSNISSLRIAPNYSNYYNRNGGPALTKAIFTKLDANKDDALSEKELASAHRLLDELDQNEDETLVSTEIDNVPPRARLPIGRQGGQMMRPGMMGSTSSLFYLVPKEKKANQLTQRLAFAREVIKRYDADKSGRLTRAEIGISEKMFTLLDGNRNNVLDPVELLKWIILKPDLELSVHLGKRKSGQAQLELFLPKIKQKVADIKLPADNTLTMAVQGVEVQLQALAGRAVNRTNVNQYYTRLFFRLDTKKRGYVTLDEIDKAGQTYRYYRTFAVNSDANNDGKVTEKEITSYMTLMGEARNCVSSFSIRDVGRGLFQMIDENGDSRLSGRELKSAGKKLMVYDKNKDGKVSINEIPRQYQLSLNPGGTPTYVYTGGVSRPGTVIKRSGPIWFQKMDRNRDGDISKREFLGNPELFKKADLNQDDYISLAEAREIEKKYGKN